jgi:hypothetical protein
MMKKFRTQVRWDSTLPTIEEQALSARYYCEHCDQPWDENMRRQAVERGRWIAKKPFRGVAGFGFRSSTATRGGSIRSSSISSRRKTTRKICAASSTRRSPKTSPTRATLPTGRRWSTGAKITRSSARAERRAGADRRRGRAPGSHRSRARRLGPQPLVLGSAEGDLRGPHVGAARAAGEPSPWEQLEAFLAEVYPHELGGDIRARCCSSIRATSRTTCTSGSARSRRARHGDQGHGQRRAAGGAAVAGRCDDRGR